MGPCGRTRGLNTSGLFISPPKVAQRSPRRPQNGKPSTPTERSPRRRAVAFAQQPAGAEPERHGMRAEPAEPGPGAERVR